MYNPNFTHFRHESPIDLLLCFKQVESTLKIVVISFFCLFAVAISAVATTTDMGEPLFTEITSAVGLEDTSERWPSDGTYTLPEIMGGGVALFDYDNDGDLDLLQIRSLLFRGASG